MNITRRHNPHYLMIMFMTNWGFYLTFENPFSGTIGKDRLLR